MATSDSSGATVVIALLVGLLVIAIATYVAWRGGVFGGEQHALDPDVSAPRVVR